MSSEIKKSVDVTLSNGKTVTLRRWTFKTACRILPRLGIIEEFETIARESLPVEAQPMIEDLAHEDVIRIVDAAVQLNVTPRLLAGFEAVSKTILELFQQHVEIRKAVEEKQKGA